MYADVMYKDTKLARKKTKDQHPDTYTWLLRPLVFRIDRPVQMTRIEVARKSN